ncbi:hypothetical protein GCK32_014043, partial [Trichostrongylus colubriformis]
SVLEWSNIVNEIGLDYPLSEAVYRNASGDEATAPLSSLAIHILLVGLEYFTYEADEPSTIRGDVVTAMVHQQMGKFSTFPSEFVSSIDMLFEGMTEDDESGESHDEIVKASDIIQKLWFKDNEISLRKLIANMRQCLVQDPFQIDDLSVNTPSCSSRRVTSLTNSRRKVTVSGWQRFQLLTKVSIRN